MATIFLSTFDEVMTLTECAVSPLLTQRKTRAG